MMRSAIGEILLPIGAAALGICLAVGTAYLYSLLTFADAW